MTKTAVHKIQILEDFDRRRSHSQKPKPLVLKIAIARPNDQGSTVLDNQPAQLLAQPEAPTFAATVPLSKPDM
jgi:hypothetical protein